MLCSTLNKINLTLCNFELCNIFWGHLITKLKVLLYFILEKKTKKYWFLNISFISLGNWALVGLMCQPKVSSLFSILLWNLKPKMLVCSASFTYWIAGIQMVSVIPHCLGMNYYVNFLGGIGSNGFHIKWIFGTHGSWKKSWHNNSFLGSLT